VLKYCGLCGYFKRFKNEQSFGSCKAGHRKAHSDATFSTNSCNYFKHKRHFLNGKIVPIYENRMIQRGGA